MAFSRKMMSQRRVGNPTGESTPRISSHSLKSQPVVLITFWIAKALLKTETFYTLNCKTLVCSRNSHIYIDSEGKMSGKLPLFTFKKKSNTVFTHRWGGLSTIFYCRSVIAFQHWKHLFFSAKFFPGHQTRGNTGVRIPASGLHGLCAL